MINQIHLLFSRKFCLFSLLSAITFSPIVSAEKTIDHYGTHPKALLFVEKMVDQHGFDRVYVQNLMNNAQKKQKILDAIARPAEKTKSWKQYRKIFLSEKRTMQGKAFLRDQAETLARAEHDFGVPKEIIAAIIGVETQYGKYKGNWRVVDALATLGFDYPPRSKFFSRELEQYLLMVREQKLDAKEVKGSYAGAIGYGQFIPSSYRSYAIDFDGDGIADIVNNVTDAIGSVANYFKAHGWRPGEQITSGAEVIKDYNSSLANGKLKPKYTVGQLREQGYKPVLDISNDAMATPLRLMGELGEEHWLGLQNFYVITRYNHSRLYAMAVFQLSETLK
ncbi:MAG: membrane-bound lytic murein transglycosylase B [Oceanicoccus sp.]|jgi:membrane-bound lytic murein transglycosylase B